MSTINFDYEPDPEKLAQLVARFAKWSRTKVVVLRYRKDGSTKDNSLKVDRFLEEFPSLTQVDIDFFFRPGNASIRGWAYLELFFQKRNANLVYHGLPEHFRTEVDFCIERLGLRKSRNQIVAENYGRCGDILQPSLFRHVNGSLKEGNYAASLSAAVVLVEDTLRGKVGSRGVNATGGQLAEIAYKAPGILIPPLPLATNAQDSAFLLLRGWFGYVRNLHGHQSSVPMTTEQGFSQILGVNYALWIVENSVQRP